METYRKYERPPGGGQGDGWRTGLVVGGGGGGVKELGFQRVAAGWGQISGMEMPTSSVCGLNSDQLFFFTFFQALNSISLVLSVYPSSWLALPIQLNQFV